MSMQAARTATRDPARSRLDTALLATLVVALVLLALKCAWA